MAITRTGLTDTQLRATPIDTNVTSSSLPTNAATESKQDTIIGHVDGIENLLTNIDAGIPAALGQTTMAASMPVAIASNQSAIPVSQSGTWTVGLSNNSVITYGNTAFYSGSASSATNIIAFGDVYQYKDIRFQITGTFVAQVVLEGSDDNSNWRSMPFVYLDYPNRPPNNVGVFTPGLFSATLSSRYLRLRVSSYTSGTVTATALLNSAPQTDLGARNVTVGGIGDGAHVDAFFRLRTSAPQTIFDSKLIYDDQPLYWDESQVSGSGTSGSHSAARASKTLSVSASTAGLRVRQTRRRFNYQSGKSQQILMTGVIGAGATGITKFWGYGDDQNGLFFKQSGTTFSVVRRTYVSGAAVDNEVTQANFNGDPVNGTGLSGVVLDFTKAQIFFIDFQWLGAGRVRLGVVVNDQVIVLHTFYGTNTLTSVTMSTPNLPLRYSIENSGSGGAASLECICCTVISESGSRLTGTTTAIDRGISGLVTGVGSTAVVPLLSVRLKSDYLGASIEVDALTVINSTDANFRWALILNPTIAGVDAASWTSVTNSAVEYDISRTATNTVSGGYVVASGYGSDLLNSVNQGVNNLLKLGSSINGTRDELVLVAQNLTASNETYFGSLSLLEAY